MSSINRIRRITVTAGGTHYTSLVPVDAAQKASGSVISGQHVTTFVDPDATDGKKRNKFVTEES